MKPPHLLLNAPLTRRAALIHSDAGPVPNHIVHKVNPGSCKASAQSRSICLKSQPWIAPVVADCSMGKVDGAGRNDAGTTVSTRYRRVFADTGHFPPISRIFGPVVMQIRRTGWRVRRTGWPGTLGCRRPAPRPSMPVANREVPVLTLPSVCLAAMTVTFQMLQPFRPITAAPAARFLATAGRARGKHAGTGHGRMRPAQVAEAHTRPLSQTAIPAAQDAVILFARALLPKRSPACDPARPAGITCRSPATGAPGPACHRHARHCAGSSAPRRGQRHAPRFASPFRTLATSGRARPRP